MGGTAIYYNRALYCCPMDIPPLTNIEATACRLSTIGHGVLTLVSVYLPPKKKLLRSDLKVLLALGDAVILFGDFNSKNTNWKCNYTNYNGRKMEALAEDLHFNIITPPTPTFYHNNVRYRPDILDIALMRGIRLSYRGLPPLRKTITSWKKVSAALEETDTPVLNNIPDDIVSTDDIDNAIGALTSHITTVVENSSRKVPAKSDRKELPRDVIELIRDKNAALRRAGKYPTRENRSRARALQRRVKARIKEIKNDNWSDLMAEISPSHQAYWRLAKALKTEGAVPTPALKRPDNSIAFDDREKAECLADSIEHQCSENPHTTQNMSGGWKRRFVIESPPTQRRSGSNYAGRSQQTHKGLKIRKSPGRDTISSKAIKCFSAPLWLYWSQF
ncbi:RNA-directed DNA polymerase from mobile element jockey [Eumeta japonica]|uniref:RNA-directed DNA polymerase from mobile element jockey n=1 Tax=Eumeta variegata TaxID=151549 RepID=A0A4C1ZRA0_EUMVA|nr:RNA-directed DNA polymerase from mobile element jockey [Eumeta japonica]